MALETFANNPLTIVSAGGTTAPAAGTVETWTVSSATAFPAAVTNISCFHVADLAQLSEVILVTNDSGSAWTVTRGAEGTTPVAHTGGFTVTQVTTAGVLGREPDVPFARIVVCGHSYPSGYLTTEGGEQWPQRLAAAMHSEAVTYCKTSAVLAQDDSNSGNSGGYATVINGMRPRQSGTSAYADRTAAPYIALSPVTCFEYGLNDLAYITATTATNVAWFEMAMRTATCVARAGGIFADTHASVAYGGSGGSHWSANTAETFAGSPTNHQTSTVNDTVTITVPADFPGGEVDLLTLTYQGGTAWSTTVDGGTAQVLTGTGSAFGSNSGRCNGVIQRLTGLTAGTHTIVATVTAIDAGSVALFDSWLIAAPSLPLVVICTEMAGSPAFPMVPGGSPAHTPITTADVNALNVAILALPAEFTDGLVVNADVNAYFGAAAGYGAYGTPGSLYVSDNFHPNAAGHAVMAQCVRDAIRAAPISALPPGSTWRGVALYGPMGLVMRQVQAAAVSYGDPGFATGWTAYSGGNGAMFARDRANRTEINMSLVNTSSPASGATIFTLPPGYEPETEKMLPAISWNSGLTVASVAICAARANGTVVWYSGTPGIKLDICGSFQANGLGY